MPTDKPTDQDRQTVTRMIDAPPARLFAILADPAQHSRLDGSGMVRGAASEGLVTRVGDVFVMDMHYEKVGDYQVANHVDEFEQDRKIAWAVAPTQGDLLGHRWIWEFAPSADGTTLVIQAYDWSGVKDGGMLKRSIFPLVSAEQMTETMDRLVVLVCPI